MWEMSWMVRAMRVGGGWVQISLVMATVFESVERRVDMKDVWGCKMKDGWMDGWKRRSAWE
jgi:hypothetical protein